MVGGKAREGGEDGVYLYRPHVNNISSLHISPLAPEQLWSASYDGTVRCTDIERQQAFVEIYPSSMSASGDIMGGEEVSFHDAAFSGAPGAAYLGCRSGEVVMLDTRSGAAGWTAKAHDGRLFSSVWSRTT